MIGTSAYAQEACGLKDVEFGTSFVDGFDPATNGGGIGPNVAVMTSALSTATPVGSAPLPVRFRLGVKG